MDTTAAKTEATTREVGRMPNAYAGQVMTGAEFVALFPEYCACKFIGHNMGSFRYTLGLMVDPNELTMREASPGGLYFTDVSTLYDRLGQYGTEVAIIRIPADARVFIESHSACKADKFEVLDIQSLDDFVWGLDISTLKRALPALVRHYPFTPEQQAYILRQIPTFVFPTTPLHK